jgi:glycine cleavage system T protein (aminomethyltransferase)
MLTPSSSLLGTPLYKLHREQGARFAPFAGYEMPVQYAAGILKEHLHTRQAAGVFDVSHMGQIAVRPRRGELDVAQRALERVVPSDVLGLAVGQQRYSVLTNADAGIIDDVMVGNLGDHLLLIVNASRKAEDLGHLRTALAEDCIPEELTDRALIAVQGPASELVVTRSSIDAPNLRFMDIRRADFDGAACTISRSGYTGEDGFEISVPIAAAETLARWLLAQPETTLVGLGARDTLRLEAGLCLYGADLDEKVTPIEAGLPWVIGKPRRPSGERAGGFPGAVRIFAQLEKRPARLRVGVKPGDRTIIRGGTTLFADASGGEAIGTVTSGGFGPTVNGPIAIAYIAGGHAAPGTPVFAEVRGRRIPAEVASLPFVPHRYKR